MPRRRTPEERYRRGEITRQRVWQLRKIEAGLCIQCGDAKAVVGQKCVSCSITTRENKRRYYGYRTKHQSKSRMLEEKFRPPEEFLDPHHD